MSTTHHEEHIFTPNKRAELDPLECQISAILWNWRFAAVADRDRLIADTDLASKLEYWMPFNEIETTRKLGTWCDGIPLLTVADINRTAFAIAGVGWFPDRLAPFELEFHYKHRRDLQTTKIVFKFGTLGRDGHSVAFDTSEDPAKVYLQRPRHTKAWAVAVELTPIAE